MANITVTVPDEVYRRARVRAAEAGTSVSALVRDYLASLDDSGAEFQRLVDLQSTVLAEVLTFSARDRLSRDEVHGRAVR